MNPIHASKNFVHLNSEFRPIPEPVREHSSTKPFPSVINALSSRAIGLKDSRHIQRTAQAVSVRSRIQQCTYLLSCLRSESVEQKFLDLFKTQLLKMDKQYVFQEVVEVLKRHCNTAADLKLIEHFVGSSQAPSVNILNDNKAKDSFFRNLSQLEPSAQEKIVSTWKSSMNKSNEEKTFLSFLHKHSSLDFQKKALYDKSPNTPNTSLIQEKILGCEKPEELKFVLLYQISFLKELLDNRNLFKANIDGDRVLKQFLSFYDYYFYINFDNEDNALKEQFIKKALKHYPDIVFAGIEKMGLDVSYLSSLDDCLFASCTKSQRPLSSIFPCLKSLIVVVDPEEDIYASSQEEEDWAMHQAVFKEISKLSQLQDLELKVDCLSSDLFSSLSELPNLETLKLVFNGFSSDDFLDSEPLVAVKHLGLLFNVDEDSDEEKDTQCLIECLQLFPTLSSLMLNGDIANLYVDGIRQESNPNPRLESLIFDTYGIQDYNFLRKLQHLKSLSMNGEINDISSFPVLSDLEELSFNINNDVIINKNILNSCPSLRSLKLVGELTTVDALEIEALSDLRILDLSQVRLAVTEKSLMEKLSQCRQLSSIRLHIETDFREWPLILQNKIQLVLP